jgi:hypothetical protein
MTKYGKSEEVFACAWNHKTGSQLHELGISQLKVVRNKVDVCAHC